MSGGAERGAGARRAERPAAAADLEGSAPETEARAAALGDLDLRPTVDTQNGRRLILY